MWFFKKKFVFYLPKLNKYIEIKAKDESYAVYELCRRFRSIEHLMENYEIINGVKPSGRAQDFDSCRGGSIPPTPAPS